MKLNKLMLVAALGLSTAAVADIQENPTKDVAKKEFSKFDPKGAEFGAYRLEPGLTTVPASIASADEVIGSVGSMAVVELGENTDPGLVGEGTIVRNIFTNKLTTLTGHITILLEKNANADDVAAQAGMTVASIFPGTDIAVFKINSNADLLEALKALQASDSVVQSKIEVADTIYTTR